MLLSELGASIKKLNGGFCTLVVNGNSFFLRSGSLEVAGSDLDSMATQLVSDLTSNLDTQIAELQAKIAILEDAKPK